MHIHTYSSAYYNNLLSKTLSHFSYFALLAEKKICAVNFFFASRYFIFLCIQVNYRKIYLENENEMNVCSYDMKLTDRKYTKMSKKRVTKNNNIGAEKYFSLSFHF